MRTKATLAALAGLAVTAAACGSPARTTSAAPVAARAEANADMSAPDVPDRGARPVRVAIHAEHDHATHDHATHDHATVEAQAEPSFWAEPHKTPRYIDYGRWHTPEAAMRYLARAYTAHDDVALRHVTNPAARDALVAMRDYAPDLRLVSCVDSQWGSYTCTFSHAIKNSTKRGSATLAANPALKPGWYATALTDCGD